MMAQKSERADEVIRRRLAEIRTWQHQGLGERQIAHQLSLARSTFHDALKRVQVEKTQAKDVLHVDEGIPEPTALAKVYEGIHISTSETSLVLPAEIAHRLP